MTTKRKDFITIKTRKNVTYIIKIDPEDYDRIMAAGPWHIDSHGYPAHSQGKQTLLLHRFVMGCDYGDDLTVDHINRDPLDCRKENLRLVTKSENARNRSKHKVGGSKYKGVSKSGKNYMARIRDLSGTQRYLGSFKHEVDAAEAFDRACLRLGFPEATNFPVEAYAAPSLYTMEDYRKAKMEAMALDQLEEEQQRQKEKIS